MLQRAPLGGVRCRWWGGEAGACTESLGSDSGDVGCDAAEIERFFAPPAPPAAGGGGPDAADVAALCGEEEAAAARAEKRRRGGFVGGFPPAMPRATGPLFLRAERGGGRLVLTEVRGDDRGRRVVFRAERDAGRLRLRFANDDDVPEARGGRGAGGVVVPASVQHGGGGGGELCQVAAVAGRRGGVEVGAVLMGTTAI